jgi:hypothetical protein
VRLRQNMGKVFCNLQSCTVVSLRRKLISTRLVIPSLLLAVGFLCPAAHSQSVATVTNLTVPSTMVLGQSFTVAVSVQTTSGFPISGGQVELYNAGVDTGLSATSNNSGIATFAFGGGNALFAGNYTLGAKFLGTTGYTASSTAMTAPLAITSPVYTTTADGLQVATVTPGTGTGAVTGQLLTAQYTGFYQSSGAEFDESSAHTPGTFSYVLNATPEQVIQGFDEGTTGILPGETRVLVIPSSLGYMDGFVRIFVVHCLSVGPNTGVGLTTQLVFGQAPTATSSGVINPAITVKLLDANGNLDSTDTSMVTLSIDSGPSGATLGGTTTVSAKGGVATFADIVPSAKGTYQLIAQDGKLSVTSAAFSVIAGGVATATSLSLSASPSASTYGSPVTLTATLSPSSSQGVSSDGNTVTFLNGMTVLGTGTFTSGIASLTASLLPAGTDLITAQFFGNSALAASASAAVQLVVRPASLTVTGSNASRLFGTANPVLTGTVSGAVNGDVFTVSATTTANQSTPVGSYPVAATASGTNLADYAITTVNGTLTVTQGVPTITWSGPAAIVVGTALSATQLNATASVPGTFVYNPAAGTVPAVGNDTLAVTFTPSDSIDYQAATATVILPVNAPPNPTPVVSGLSPGFTSAGSATFTLTVTGSGFTSASVVYFGTSALATQFVSATQVTAAVTSAQIATAGLTSITVQTPTPGGGSSNSLQFEVDGATSGSGNGPTFTTLTATVTGGASATYAVTLPVGTTNVSVNCLNLPAGAACSYSATSNALTITTSTTTPKGVYQITVVFTETQPGTATGFILLPFLLLPLLFARRRVNYRSIGPTVWLGIALIAATTFGIGCGGSGSGSVPSHTITSSGAVTLTVQ